MGESAHFAIHHSLKVIGFVRASGEKCLDIWDDVWTKFQLLPQYSLSGRSRYVDLLGQAADGER